MRELKMVIITVLIVGLFITLFTFWTGDMYTGYPDVDNVSYIGASRETMEKVQEMQESIEGAEPSAWGTFWFYVTSPFRVAIMVLESLNIINSISTDVGNVLHVPPVVINVFFAIMTVIILFGIFSIVLRTPTGGY